MRSDDDVPGSQSGMSQIILAMSLLASYQPPTQDEGSFSKVHLHETQHPVNKRNPIKRIKNTSLVTRRKKRQGKWMEDFLKFSSKNLNNQAIHSLLPCCRERAANYLLSKHEQTKKEI